MLVDIVMNEVRKIHINEGDSKNFIQFVNVIERGYADLCTLNIEKEMSNSITVSMIEEKLPNDIRREWSKKVNKSHSSVDPFDKFPHLMKFLVEQKHIIEYEMADLRVSSCDYTAPVYYSSHRNEFQNSRRGLNSCIIHTFSRYSTEECNNYLAKTSEEKLQLLRELRACWSCLKVGHRYTQCRSKQVYGTENCDKYHHNSLHDAHVSGISFHAIPTVSNCERELDSCLLPLMYLRSGDIELPTLWDSGASISLITLKIAERLHLKRRVSSFIYYLPLVDGSGNIVKVNVYAIERISQPIQNIGINGTIHEFKGVKLSEVRRPTGEIDLLLGFNYASLHPVKEKSIGNLVLMKNRFGKCLAGSRHLLRERNELVNRNVSIHHARFHEDDFLSIESLGIQCVPRCGSCKCGGCQLGGKDFSIREEREHNLINEGLHYKNGCWLADYPWIKDPADLPDNRIAALKILESTERRLAQNNEHAEIYK